MIIRLFLVKNRWILLTAFLILGLSDNILSNYTPQPIILVHGRGMKDGNNWEKIETKGCTASPFQWGDRERDIDSNKHCLYTLC